MGEKKAAPERQGEAGEAGAFVSLRAPVIGEESRWGPFYFLLGCV